MHGVTHAAGVVNAHDAPWPPAPARRAHRPRRTTTTGRVIPTDAAHAIDRFTPTGPTGYRAATAPDAPIRATRAEAETDEMTHIDADPYPNPVPVPAGRTHPVTATTAPAPVNTATAHRAKFHDARRHFENGGIVLVSDRGHEPTLTVTPTCIVHTNQTTTWDALVAVVRDYGDPRQRYYTLTGPKPTHACMWRPGGPTAPRCDATATWWGTWTDEPDPICDQHIDAYRVEADASRIACNFTPREPRPIRA